MTAEATTAREARRAARTALDWRLAALLCLFFGSGVSALIYQTLWLRLLALVFGVTVWAATTVLASFMAGLALGSFVAGRIADRSTRPLLLFALAEALVGLSALATPWALRVVEGAYAAMYGSLPEGVVWVTAARFALSFAVLIVPTTLMGATLPLVVRSALVRDGPFAERVSLLYATNTAGAVMGALAAGFYLIGGIGIGASFALAAAINLSVGLGAALLERFTSSGAGSLAPTPSHGESATPGARGESAAVSDRTRLIVLIVFALSGLTSLAQEVIWFRVLVLLQPATAYAFTVMLATFLCGIAAGSYASALLARLPVSRLALLGAVEVGIGVASIGGLAVLALALREMALLLAIVHRSLNESLLMLGVVSFLAVFPATLLMGVAFPIGLQIWTTAGGGTGRRVGTFYAWNVVGAILGAPLAGFVLLPALGSRGSMLVVAAVSLVGGLALLAQLRRRGVALTAGAAGVALFAAAAWHAPEPTAAVLSYRFPDEREIWREEGIQTTVAVQKADNGSTVLRLDGWPQASDDAGGVAVHRLIGSLPIWLHPNPRSALVVGLGGGATPGAIAQHRGVQVDIVELSDSVVRGSDHLRHINLDVLRQPNVRLRVDDGRNHLLLSGRRYDVITADAIWPLHAGSGNLYSQEYFRLVRSALTDDGLTLQWLGARTEGQYKLLVRTFLSVFPDATAWHHGTLLIGGKGPPRISRSAFEQRLREPGFLASLNQLEIRDLDGVLALYWAGPEELGQFVGPGPVLTDDRPRLEYFRSLSDKPATDERLTRVSAGRRLVASD